MFICSQIAILVQDDVLNLVHNDVHNVHKIINVFSSVILPVLFRLKINNEELRIREASVQEKCSFFNIVQKAFGPPPLPLSFEHYLVNFSEGILTKVRKRLSQQLSTK